MLCCELIFCFSHLMLMPDMIVAVGNNKTKLVTASIVVGRTTVSIVCDLGTVKHRPNLNLKDSVDEKRARADLCCKIIGFVLNGESNAQQLATKWKCSSGFLCQIKCCGTFFKHLILTDMNLWYDIIFKLRFVSVYVKIIYVFIVSCLPVIYTNSTDSNHEWVKMMEH